MSTTDELYKKAMQAASIQSGNSGKEYGVFNDEGLLESGFFTKEEAAMAAAQKYPEEKHVYIALVCQIHEEQEAAHCEKCDENDEDEEDQSSDDDE